METEKPVCLTDYVVLLEWFFQLSVPGGKKGKKSKKGFADIDW